jgi:hypothetical protein
VACVLLVHKLIPRSCFKIHLHFVGYDHHVKWNDLYWANCANWMLECHVRSTLTLERKVKFLELAFNLHLSIPLDSHLFLGIFTTSILIRRS